MKEIKNKKNYYRDQVHDTGYHMQTVKYDTLKKEIGKINEENEKQIKIEEVESPEKTDRLNREERAFVICRICKKEYENKSVSRHLAKHQWYRYYCEFGCRTWVKRKDSLARHHQQHLKEKQWECKGCLRRFQRKRDMKNHKKKCKKYKEVKKNKKKKKKKKRKKKKEEKKKEMVSLEELQRNVEAWFGMTH